MHIFSQHLLCRICGGRIKLSHGIHQFGHHIRLIDFRNPHQSFMPILMYDAWAFQDSLINRFTASHVDEICRGHPINDVFDGFGITCSKFLARSNGFFPNRFEPANRVPQSKVYVVINFMIQCEQCNFSCFTFVEIATSSNGFQTHS